MPVEGGTEELVLGAGLGLAITKRTVELHGSAITVQSTLGAGFAFTFSFPIVQHE